MAEIRTDEAIRVLESMGLVTSRRRVGVTVSPAPLNDCVNTRPYAKNTNPTLTMRRQLVAYGATAVSLTPGWLRSEAMLEAYRHATEVERTGAVMFGNEMIDEASRKMAIQFAERGRAAGMTVSKKLGDFQAEWESK